jgi:hypothetical protein
MARYKYPAPFDPPETPQVWPDNAPLPPSPPLPVDIPVEKPTTRVRRSLYRDLFGTDLSVIMEALHAPWASREQQELATQIVDGQKQINSLSTADDELLDDLVIRFNDQGGDREEVQPTDRQRLPIPNDLEDGDGDEELQSSGGSDVQSDVPSSISTAYSWLQEGGDE